MNLLKQISNVFHLFRLYGARKFFFFLFSELKAITTASITKSYSQNKEDLFIYSILHKKKGFYIDVGANDPVRFSNTKKFYDLGWRGINIEPNPTKFKKLLAARSEDVNLNIGISRKSQALDFFIFDPDTLSTFSKDDAKKYKKLGYKMVEKIKVKTSTLKEILSASRVAKKIDLLSTDTEGFDYQVLSSNDWKRHRPKLICIETVDFSDGNNLNREESVADYLKKQGYREIYNNGVNSIFQDRIRLH